MRLVIVGTDLPGLFGGHVHVGVQRGAEPEQLAPGDAGQASFTVELTVRRPDGGLDFTGPYVHGRRGDRFVYLTWGQVSDGSFEMFRRAKITLDPGNPVLGEAADTGAAVSVRLGLTDARGGPLCAGSRRTALTGSSPRSARLSRWPHWPGDTASSAAPPRSSHDSRQDVLSRRRTGRLHLAGDIDRLVGTGE